MSMLYQKRTIISAMNPERYEDSYTEIFLKVWFEEIDEAVDFLASPLDCERHGKELWIRAMSGEFGRIEVLSAEQSPMRLFEKKSEEHRQRLLTYDPAPKDADA